jgi:hypothetical protein
MVAPPRILHVVARKNAGGSAKNAGGRLKPGYKLGRCWGPAVQGAGKIPGGRPGKNGLNDSVTIAMWFVEGSLCTKFYNGIEILDSGLLQHRL